MAKNEKLKKFPHFIKSDLLFFAAALVFIILFWLIFILLIQTRINLLVSLWIAFLCSYIAMIFFHMFLQKKLKLEEEIKKTPNLQRKMMGGISVYWLALVLVIALAGSYLRTYSQVYGLVAAAIILIVILIIYWPRPGQRKFKYAR